MEKENKTEHAICISGRAKIEGGFGMITFSYPTQWLHEEVGGVEGIYKAIDAYTLNRIFEVCEKSLITTKRAGSECSDVTVYIPKSRIGKRFPPRNVCLLKDEGPLEVIVFGDDPLEPYTFKELLMGFDFKRLYLMAKAKLRAIVKRRL